MGFHFTSCYEATQGTTFYLRFGPSEIHHSPGFSRVSRGNDKYILSLGLMNVFLISFASPLTVKNDA